MFVKATTSKIYSSGAVECSPGGAQPLGGGLWAGWGVVLVQYLLYLCHSGNTELSCKHTSSVNGQQQVGVIVMFKVQ